MFSSRKKLALLAIGVGLIPTLLFARARGSDHADTPAIAALPGTDLSDVYIFPSPSNANNVVLVMCVHPVIPSGAGLTTDFDPNVLYQFKIDNSGDFKEDLVIQAKFTGSGATQKVQIAGPVAPSRTGTVTQFETPDSVSGTINNTFTTSTGIKVFTGGREDPFFFDLEQFFKILPDRNVPGIAVSTTTPANSFRPAADAKDFLSVNNLNVLSIVVELPKSQLGSGKIGVWCTTSK